MSSWYKIEVSVNAFDLTKEDAIIEAARTAWDFDNVTKTDKNVKTLYISGESQVGGEITDYIGRFAKAIWKANGKYCDIDVQALCVEDLPFEDYSLDDEDYTRLMGEVKT